MRTRRKLKYKPNITKREIRRRLKEAGPPGPSLGELVGLVPVDAGWDNSILFSELVSGMSYLSPRGHLIQIFHHSQKIIVYKLFFPGERAKTCQEDATADFLYYPIDDAQVDVLRRVWKDSLARRGLLRQGDEIREVLMTDLGTGPVHIGAFAEKYDFSYGSVNTQRKYLEDIDRIIERAGRGTYKLKE